MVKGISRQIIMVQAPEPKLFEQAIFILNDNAVGKEEVTDEVLLKEAQQAIRGTERPAGRGRFALHGALWAAAGALATALVWLVTVLV